MVQLSSKPTGAPRLSQRSHWRLLRSIISRSLHVCRALTIPGASIRDSPAWSSSAIDSCNMSRRLLYPKQIDKITSKTTNYKGATHETRRAWCRKPKLHSSKFPIPLISPLCLFAIEEETFWIILVWLGPTMIASRQPVTWHRILPRSIEWHSSRSNSLRRAPCTSEQVASDHIVPFNS